MTTRVNKSVNVISESEAKVIFSNITNQIARLALITMYFCGLRLNELLQLRVEDLDVKEKSLSVKISQKMKGRPIKGIIPIPEWLIHELLSTKTASGWLFPNHDGTGHISTAQLQKAFMEALIKSGIKKQFTVASLRHSRVLQLCKQNIGLEKI